MKRRIPHRSLAFLLAGLLFSAAGPAASRAAAAEGKIERTRQRFEDEEEGKKEERERSRPGRPHGEHPTWDEDDGEDDSFALAFAETFLIVLVAPFWAPPALLDDTPLAPSLRPYRFEPYPYAEGARGHLRLLEMPPLEEPLPPHEWNFSLRTLYAYEYVEDDLDGHRFEALARSNARFNADFSITDYVEDLAGDETDRLWHWKTHLTYSFAVAPEAHFAAGVGARGLDWESGGSEAGLDFRYEAELFPARPVHLWLTAETGWVDDESVWELEARIGVHYDRFEAFVGYHHLDLAGEDFAGPVAGLAAWF